MPEHHHTIAEVSTRESMAVPVASVIQRTGNCNHAEEFSPSSLVKRPSTLTLEPKHRRIPSNDGSGETTPAPDPPLISPAACELLQTCPPANQYFQQSRMEFQVGASPSQRHPICTAQSGLPMPSLISASDTDAQRYIRSRMIADRIRTIGDRYERQYGEHQLESWLSAIIFSQNPASTGFTSMLWGRLQKVREIFQTGYCLLKVLTAECGLNVNKLPQEDKQWTLFQRLLDMMMNIVSPSFLEHHGGWMAFPQATEGVEDDITASATVVSHRAQPQPVTTSALQNQ